MLPDSGTLTYSYVAGALTQLESALPGSGDVDVLIDGIEHSASGGLELLQAQAVSLSGPPIATVYSYRPTDDRLEGVATTVDPGGTPELVQDFFYEYDTAGNLLSVDDGLDKLDQGFAYDRLHRLTLAGGLGSQGYGLLQYEYDDAGNLLGKGPGTNGSPQNGRVRLAYGRPPTGGPPSVVSVDYHNGSNWINGFGAFEYDADGAMIQRRVLFSTWDQPQGRDGAGRIYYTDLPGNEYAFYYYDHEGQRFERDRLARGQPQVWHEYVDPSFEADWLANTHEVHLFVDGRRVATLQRPGRGATETSPTDAVQFYAADQLGSNTLVMDASGQVIQETFLKPFGEVHAMLIDGQAVGNPDSSITPYLTDQERDAETDLHYFGARYYDPWIGRFMSQDPELISAHTGITFAGIQSDPQDFNAYSYVRNSPTVFTDPTGAFRTPEPPPPPPPPDRPFPRPEGMNLGGPRLGATPQGVQTACGPATPICIIIIADALAQAAAWTGIGLLTGYTASEVWGLISQQSGEESSDDEGTTGKENTADQDAAIQLAKEAKRKGGLTPDEAAALLEQAREAGLPVRGPESHPDRPNKGTHIHIGPIGHIPVR